MKNRESKNGLVTENKSKISLRPHSVSKSKPTKNQVDRLKKFYNTTRWLPNSAFTTYFGKPAFENYGYGNTKPVYGGLFYGNYMLSHNINPIDGENYPDEKQVYSSAMLKTIQRNKSRKPEPPRKTPDEIRNTPEELLEINQRKPIFQYKNCFPKRGIHVPDLLKVKYFKSAKNSPNESFEEENEDNQFDIENVLNPGKKHKKKVKFTENIDSAINPFANEKVNLKKKKNKAELDNTTILKSIKNDSQLISQKEYFEKMLSQDISDEDKDKNNLENSKIKENTIKLNEDNNTIDENNRNLENCKYCNNSFINFKNKSNPCLVQPEHINYTHVCCVHNLNDKITPQELDPRNYKYMPVCALNKIHAAGKPVRISESVASLFK